MLWHYVNMKPTAADPPMPVVDDWYVNIAVNTNWYDNLGTFSASLNIAGQGQAPLKDFQYVYWLNIAVPFSDPRFVLGCSTGAMTAVQINAVWVQRRSFTTARGQSMSSTAWIMIERQSETGDYRWQTATEGWTSWRPKTSMPNSNAVHVGAFTGPANLHNSPNRYAPWDDIFQSTQSAEYRWPLPDPILAL